MKMPTTPLSIFSEFQGVGINPAAMQAAIHTPWAVLQAAIAAGTAAPPVLTPAVPPAPVTQATQTVLHPVWQIPYAAGPPCIIIGPQTNKIIIKI